MNGKGKKGFQNAEGGLLAAEKVAPPLARLMSTQPRSLPCGCCVSPIEAARPLLFLGSGLQLIPLPELGLGLLNPFILPAQSPHYLPHDKRNNSFPSDLPSHVLANLFLCESPDEIKLASQLSSLLSTPSSPKHSEGVAEVLQSLGCSHLAALALRLPPR